MTSNNCLVMHQKSFLNMKKSLLKKINLCDLEQVAHHSVANFLGGK